MLCGERLSRLLPVDVPLRRLDAGVRHSLNKRRSSRPNVRRGGIRCVGQEAEELTELIQFIEAPTQPKRPTRCYGCGVDLQTEDRTCVGYIVSKKLQTKLQHKQYDQLLCERCVQLTHGRMIPAVEDRRGMHREYPLKSLLTPEALRDQLKGVRNKKVLVVLLVDLLDLPGSFLSSIRPLIGMNPIFLVGTKLDLLPTSSHLRDIQEWLREQAVMKKLHVLDVHLISNRKKTGLSRAASAILRTRNGRDVYVMGLANVGKSAFVRAFLNELRTLGSSNFTTDAMSKGRFLPVESTMPGTTLGIIKLSALNRKGAVYDTPGVHLFHRLTHLLPPETLRQLLPTRPLSPYVPPSPYDICKQSNQRTALEAQQARMPKDQVVEQLLTDPSRVSASYFWGGLVRIDIYEAPLSMGLVFYAGSAMKVHAFPLLTPNFQPELQTEPDINRAVVQGELMQHVVTTRYLDDVDGLSTDPVAAEEADLDVEKAFFVRECVLEGGLVVAKMFEIECLGFEHALTDISISGFPGWISLMVPHLSRGRDRGWLKGRIWAPKGVEVFLRPPIPVDNPLSTGF